MKNINKVLFKILVVTVLVITNYYAKAQSQTTTSPEPSKNDSRQSDMNGSQPAIQNDREMQTPVQDSSMKRENSSPVKMEEPSRPTTPSPAPVKPVQPVQPEKNMTTPSRPAPSPKSPEINNDKNKKDKNMYLVPDSSLKHNK